MKATSLPFILTDIHAIKWSPGEDRCVITYRDQASWTDHTKKVNLDEMEAVCIGFRKLLACANACSFRNKGVHVKTAERIKAWVRMLGGARAQDFLLDRDSVHAWADVSARLEAFKFGLTTREHNGNTRAVTPFCNITWSSRMTRTMDHRLLDANCPGFSEWCSIMSNEHGASQEDAFRTLSSLALGLPYVEGSDHIQRFSSQLRACLAMGLPAREIVDTFLANLSTQEIDATVLPDLAP